VIYLVAVRRNPLRLYICKFYGRLLRYIYTVFLSYVTNLNLTQLTVTFLTWHARNQTWYNQRNDQRLQHPHQKVTGKPEVHLLTLVEGRIELTESGSDPDAKNETRQQEDQQEIPSQERHETPPATSTPGMWRQRFHGPGHVTRRHGVRAVHRFQFVLRSRLHRMFEFTR